MSWTTPLVLAKGGAGAFWKQFGRISREPQDLLFFDLNAARHSGEARGKAIMKGPLQTATKETSTTCVDGRIRDRSTS